MDLGTMRHDTGRNAQKWRVEGEDALYVREHHLVQALPADTFSIVSVAAGLAIVGMPNRLVVREGDDGLGGYDAAHGVADQDGVHGWIHGRGGRAIRHLDVDDAFEQPVPEPRHALVEVAPRLVSGICDGAHVDFGKRRAQQGCQVLGELGLGSEGVLAPLYRARSSISFVKLSLLSPDGGCPR